MTTRRNFILFILGATFLFIAPARADVLSEMENFWRGAAVNTTGPTAFDGQASGHWTLGNLYLRAPVRSESIATVSLPSYRAGCGGIDAFAGAFSFIDSDQMIAFARAVAQNAAGFAFELALETISPVIAETMSKLRALAQWVNNQNVNSCETAQALVGAVWSKNDRASAAICAAIGTRQGIFSDYAAARHGCGADGKRNSTLAAATGPLREQAPVNVNYAWRAVRASGFLASDRDLGEFAMSVSGSVIVTAPLTDSDPSGPRVRVLEPLALDRRVTEVLMEGGGDLPVYRCDTPVACLNPTLGRLTVPAARGFRNRVAELLRSRLVPAARGFRKSNRSPKPWRSTCSRSGYPISTARSRSARDPWTSPTASASRAGARACAKTAPLSRVTGTRVSNASTPLLPSSRNSGSSRRNLAARSRRICALRSPFRAAPGSHDSDGERDNPCMKYSPWAGGPTWSTS